MTLESYDCYRSKCGAKKSNAPRMSSIIPPTGLQYLAYLSPKLEVIAKAAEPKMMKSPSIKKKSYSRI